MWKLPAGAEFILSRLYERGYQAYVVAGWESNPENVHAWTMIDWPDGETYLFDPQLEFAYWYMFSGKPQIDMFKASGDGLLYNGFAYYFP